MECTTPESCHPFLGCSINRSVTPANARVLHGHGLRHHRHRSSRSPEDANARSTRNITFVLTRTAPITAGQGAAIFAPTVIRVATRGDSWNVCRVTAISNRRTGPRSMVRGFGGCAASHAKGTGPARAFGAILVGRPWVVVTVPALVLCARW